MYLQFVFEARICLNGKDLRVWSSVRPELQSIFLSAFDAVYDRMKVSSVTGSTNGSTTDAEKKSANAFEVAKALCETFVNKPVTVTIMADDEDIVIKRIATTMNVKYDSVVKPLKAFIKRYIKLPALMHDCVKLCIAGLLTYYLSMCCYVMLWTVICSECSDSMVTATILTYLLNIRNTLHRVIETQPCSKLRG